MGESRDTAKEFAEIAKFLCSVAQDVERDVERELSINDIRGIGKENIKIRKGWLKDQIEKTVPGDFKSENVAEYAILIEKITEANQIKELIDAIRNKNEEGYKKFFDDGMGNTVHNFLKDYKKETKDLYKNWPVEKILKHCYYYTKYYTEELRIADIVKDKLGLEKDPNINAFYILKGNKYKNKTEFTLDDDDRAKIYMSLEKDKLIFGLGKREKDIDTIEDLEFIMEIGCNDINEDSLNTIAEFYDDTVEFVESNGDGDRTDNGGQRIIEHPKNQILYGPPGTGKTYNTINKALEIIDGTVPLERKDAKKRFDELKESGQIVFTTFHQSYGYEEFVEGIRPKLDDSNENMTYEIRDGIFKALCKKALSKDTSSFNDKIKWLKYQCSKQNGKRPITIDNLQITCLLGDAILCVKPINSENSRNIKPSYPVSIKHIERLYENGSEGGVYNLTYASAISNYLLNLNINMNNYILIIDEINRGNISKIFGELITLIEDSKRIGADEEIRVKLPYSGDEFGVPQNVYIIGTMNTADRSIALLDTALRRRFHFEEMMPDLTTLCKKDGRLSADEAQKDSENEHDLKVGGINIRLMLKKINERIEYLYDRDHQIGHAYFMSLKEKEGDEAKAELDNIFRNKIIPLLQEYFYDDWEKILMVLGEGFIEKTKIEGSIFSYKNGEILEDEKYSYKLKTEFDYQKFATI